MSRNYQPIYATNRVAVEARGKGWACWRCGHPVPGSTGHLIYGAPCVDCREVLRAEGDRTVWDARQLAKGVTEWPAHSCEYDEQLVALFDTDAPEKAPRALSHCERLDALPLLLQHGFGDPVLLARLLRSKAATIRRNIDESIERITA